MPQLEAPVGFGESSPENSYSPDLPEAPEFPAAAIEHIRVQAPDPPANVEHVRRNNHRRAPARIGSFDRELAELEEDNHYPPAVHLLPISLPRPVPEPNLDDLLRRVTDRNDLQNVEAVRLRVISYTISLSRLAMFLPRLQHLDLSGSVLSSLRDLGYGLVHLSYLNVSNCGLNSFDGTGGLPSIRVLIGDSNMIQRVGPLAELPLLQRLSARNNRISELGLLTFLGMCPNLAEVELQGNPVCHVPLYRVTLQRSVRSLQILDGIPVNQSSESTRQEQQPQQHQPHPQPQQQQQSQLLSQILLQEQQQPDQQATNRTPSTTDGELSSLSSEACSFSDIQMNATSSTRPATAPFGDNNTRTTIIHIQPQERPVTAQIATRRDSLTLGEPVVGSVLELARRFRRQRRSGHAWGSTSVSNSSSDSASRPSSSISSNSSLEQQSTHRSIISRQLNVPED